MIKRFDVFTKNGLEYTAQRDEKDGEVLAIQNHTGDETIVEIVNLAD